MESESIDFSTILMSSVHDIKNSLVMSLGTLDSLSADASQDEAARTKIAQLQYELQRINNGLIQLLSLYKMENKLIALNIDQVNVYDFLEEQQLQNKALLDSKQITVELNCDYDLEWYFDRDLMAGTINTILNNALRYTKAKIVMSATEKDGLLEIVMEDDGRGFPEHLLNSDGPQQSGVNFSNGSTGLGIFFAYQVAKLHRRQDIVGNVIIKNSTTYGGGMFILHLP